MAYYTFNNNYKKTNDVKNYENKMNNATNTYTGFANRGYSQGLGGYGNSINSSQSKLNALYNNNNLSQQFKYSKQNDYDKALSNISNRKAFSYDLSNDQLFQQAKEQYQTMGKTAMADTIGQASAMTGGYGNSYATAVGQQTYNNYLQELNNSIGDYYSMALSTYNNETDRLNGIYNALSADRSNQSNEWSNNWSVYNNLYNMYNNELSNYMQLDQNAWQQKGANLYNAANLATNQYDTAYGNAIDIWSQSENLKAEQAKQQETARANKAQEDYNAKVLEETKRVNDAEIAAKEAEIAAKEAEEDKFEEKSTTATTKAIQEIDSLIQSKLYSHYNGDYQAAADKIAYDYLLDLHKNKMSEPELNYLTRYYNL